MNLLERYNDPDCHEDLFDEEIKVFKIIDDITSRSGIGNSFEDIDDDIKNEMIEGWVEILKEK